MKYLPTVIRLFPVVFANLLFVLGSVALVVGLSHIHEAAAWIGGGGLMVACGLGMATKRKEPKE